MFICCGVRALKHFRDVYRSRSSEVMLIDIGVIDKSNNFFITPPPLLIIFLAGSVKGRIMRAARREVKYLLLRLVDWSPIKSPVQTFLAPRLDAEMLR